MNYLKVISVVCCRYQSKNISLLRKSISYCIDKKTNTAFSKQSFIISRYFHDYEVNTRLQDMYRRKDNISNEYNIIYRAPILNYIKYAHYTSFITGLTIPAATAFYFASNGALIFPIHLGHLPMIRGYFDFCAFYVGLFFIISQISFLIAKYPIRIYASKDGNYIAVFRALLPWKTFNHSFKLGQVSQAKSFMPWGDSLYSIGTKKGFLLEDHFLRPIDFYTMLGKTEKDLIKKGDEE